MIERVYEAFAGYRHGRVEGCPCCVTEAERAALCARPLRDHDTSSLGRYAFKAMTTWGDELDFKHFLPRILELALDGGHGEPGLDLELVIGKIASAGAATWPAAERDALRAVLLDHFTRALDGDEVLSVARDLAPLVEESALITAWEARLDREPAAARRLARIVIAASRDRAPPLARWLFAQGPRLERAFEAAPSDELAEAVDLAALCQRAHTF